MYCMIDKLNSARLSSAEYLQFLVLLLEITEASMPIKLKINNEKEVLEAIIIRLKAAFDREKAFSQTKELELLDKGRDIAITAFLLWVKCLTDHPNPVKKANAIIINKYLKRHGSGIAQLNWQAESSVLTKITEDTTNNIDLKNALISLDGTEWITEINDANKAFIAKYAERTVAMGENGNKESFYVVRVPAKEAYAELVDIIESRYKTAKSDKVDVSEFKTLIDNFNATIHQFKELIKTSKPKKAAKKDN